MLANMSTNLSIKMLTKDFCQRSSSHSVPHIFNIYSDKMDSIFTSTFGQSCFLPLLRWYLPIDFKKNPGKGQTPPHLGNACILGTIGPAFHPSLTQWLTDTITSRASCDANNSLLATVSMPKNMAFGTLKSTTMKKEGGKYLQNILWDSINQQAVVEPILCVEKTLP